MVLHSSTLDVKKLLRRTEQRAGENGKSHGDLQAVEASKVTNTVLLNHRS